MKKLNLVLTSAFLSTVLTACGNVSDVNFERYTLTQDVQPESYLSTLNVSLHLAPVLDQGGVVLQISDVSLRPAKNHRYSADLDNELRVIFIDELSKASLNKNFVNYQYKLYVPKFQGTIDGKSIVSVSMQIIDPKNDQVIYTGSHSSESDISADGYGPLVTALKANYLKSINYLIDEMRKLNLK